MESLLIYAKWEPHWLALRRLLLGWFFLFGLLFAGAFYFRDVLFDFILLPWSWGESASSGLLLTGVSEPFFLTIKICLWSAFILSLPVLYIALGMFVGRGLFAHERRKMFAYAGLYLALFLLGAVVAFVGLMPITIGFFDRFVMDKVQMMPTVQSYVNLLIGLVFALGITFNLPVVLFALLRLGLLDLSYLKRNRAYWICGVFVFAAIITPTGDPLTQMVVAIPLWACFEGIIMLFERGVIKKSVASR